MAQFPELIDGLAEQGWATQESWISPNFVTALLEDQESLLKDGRFRPAGIGRDANPNQIIRSDFISWWDPRSLTAAQQHLWEKVEQLRFEINQALYLGTRYTEAHFARYAAGAHYDRHVDQVAGSTARAVSFVVYLNFNWDLSKDGGALRLYHKNGIFSDISPEAGRLVCFLSETVEHEVVRPHRARASVTGWLRRDLGQV